MLNSITPITSRDLWMVALGAAIILISSTRYLSELLDFARFTLRLAFERKNPDAPSAAVTWGSFHQYFRDDDKMGWVMKYVDGYPKESKSLENTDSQFRYTPPPPFAACASPESWRHIFVAMNRTSRAERGVAPPLPVKPPSASETFRTTSPITVTDSELKKGARGAKGCGDSNRSGRGEFP